MPYSIAILQGFAEHFVTELQMILAFLYGQASLNFIVNLITKSSCEDHWMSSWDHELTRNT